MSLNIHLHSFGNSLLLVLLEQLWRSGAPLIGDLLPHLHLLKMECAHHMIKLFLLLHKLILLLPTFRIEALALNIKNDEMLPTNKFDVKNLFLQHSLRIHISNFFFTPFTKNLLINRILLDSFDLLLFNLFLYFFLKNKNTTQNYPQI